MVLLFLRWFVFGVAAVTGIVVGTAGAALGTGAGRDVLVRTGLRFANAAVRGTVTVDEYDGSLLGGMELRGVRIVGEDGAPLLEAEGLEVRYRVRDFLSRRIALGQVILTRPRMTLFRVEDGRWNIEQIFRIGEGDGGGGSDPLVAFRDVIILNALIEVQDEGGDRTIEIPGALASYVRLVSPFPREEGIRIDLARGRMKVSSPALDILDARGRLDIHGDSVAMAMDRVRLADTDGPLSGYLRTSGGVTFDLRFEPERFASEDVAGLVPVLPAGITGTGVARVSLDARGVVEFEGDDLDLSTPDGGRLQGRLGFVVGPGDSWRANRVDVVSDSLDLDYVRPFLDTLPFAGRVTGRTVANGPSGQLTLQIDWRFQDGLANDAVTELRGRGNISFGVPGDAVFRRFAVERARVALATVQVLVPGMALRGTMDGNGSLNGPWRNAQFTGQLRHADGDLPATVARGDLRFDARTDIVGVWADLAMDSLQFDGIRPSYPAAALAGAYTGRIALAGFFSGLDLQVDLSGPAGDIRGGGTVVLLSPRLGVRDLDVEFARLTLDAFRERLPRTRLTGRATGRIAVDSAAPPVADLDVQLAASTLGSIAIDSAGARIGARDSLLVIEQFALWGRGTRMTGAGGIAVAAPRTDTLSLEVTIDSLDAALPFLLRLAGQDPARFASDTIDGNVTASLTMHGALDAMIVAARADGRRLRWNSVRAPAATATVRTGIQDGTVSLAVRVDTAAMDLLGFAALQARLEGQADSLRWFSRGRMGPDGAFLAGGRFQRDSAGMTAAFDSLVVLLARDHWFLQRGATLAVDDSAVTLNDMTFTTASGGSRVALDGVIPRRGPGNLIASVEGLQLDNLWAVAQLETDRTAGELAGTLRLGGTARAPVIAAEVGIRNAVFNEFRAPLTQGRLEYRDRRLEGEVGLWQDGVQLLNVALELPMDLALRDAGERQLPGPLNVRARAEGVDLSFISALYPLIRRTSGRFWADLGITGTWDRPELTGFLRLADGAATIPALGVRHERLRGNIRLSGDTIHVDSLSVASGRGVARLDGFVRLEGLTRPRLDLRLEASDFRAIDVPDFLSLTTSGRVALTGPVFGAELTGSGTVTRGIVYFADIIEKDIVSLEDSLLDSAKVALIRRQGLGTAFQNRFLDSLRIENLSLTMGSDMQLRSSEAQIQLAGNVTVSKTGARYRIDGVLQTPRGTYQLPLGPTITKDFSVTRGEVRYFGTPDLNAALDIDAQHRVRTVRGDIVSVFVHVGGTLNAPTLTLSSDVQPPLADTEIISYLVFGAPSAQAAGGQLGQYGVEQSIATIAGRITGQLGSALISDLGIPLDYLEVRPNITGGLGTEIVVGRQIGERVFLTLNQRFCQNQGFSADNLGASVEFRMSQQWRLSLSAEPLVSCFSSVAQIARQLGFDVLWERSY